MPHLNYLSFMTPLASPQAGYTFVGSGLSSRQRPSFNASPANHANSTFIFAHGGAALIARDHEKNPTDHIYHSDVSILAVCLIRIGFFSIEGASQLLNLSCVIMNRGQNTNHERPHLLSLNHILPSDEF